MNKTYTLAVNSERREFTSSDDAIDYGKANATDGTFVIVRDGGIPHVVAILQTSRFQSGRKGKIWCITFC
jgi:hypothetical protein